MPILTPFQGDFLVRVVPRAEALYLLSALRLLGVEISADIHFLLASSKGTR